MKKFKYLLASFVSMGIVGMTAVTVSAATDCTDPANSTAPVCQIQGGTDDTTPTGGGARTSLGTRIATIVNILLFVLGLIAVIVIVIAGIRYTTSGGDASAVKGAKDTILYAVVGLIVAILAYAIVNFILKQF